ncbi:MGMT family protein [Candidatus Pacearchaeota archaeon]|nr:MGMT family protein [Candidatus Pacearchaeota archaeon]
MELKQKIYSNLKKVPKGKVITYKELGKAVNSKAYRFVGTCMKENKYPKEIPCYKVVLSDGRIGNYSSSGGVKSKIKKLEADGIKVVNGKVDLKEYLYKL